MFKGILNKLFKPKTAQVESPFALFNAYLHNMREDIDDDGNTYYALQQSSFVLSNEYGEQVKQYNRNAASFFNLPMIEHHIEYTGDTETCTLKYKDKLISWQEVANLASDDFEVFMMSKLLADDIEIRFDTCSAGLSDHNYYALTPEIWRQLEEKYDLEFVRSHFEPMSEAFCEPDYKFKLLLSEL